MSQIPEKKWKSALTNIIEELDTSQYKKMQEYLKICKSKKTCRNKEQMAQTIIEYYGVEKSISEMKLIMKKIPRNDSTIQNFLQPFMDQLQERAGSQKNNTVSDSGSSDEEPEACKKRKYETDSKSEKQRELKAGSEKNNESHSETSEEETDHIQANKEIKIPVWRNTIKQLKTSGAADGKVIAGKVVKKSGLRTYKTKRREKKVFFYLGLADETDIIKVMVYGREWFEFFKEETFYMFREIIMEHRENQHVMKVTKATIASKTSPADVPKNLELEAQMLIYKQSPVYSIKQIQALEEKSYVSVEGTVMKLEPVKPVKMKKSRSKKNVQKFKLTDGENRIEVTLWGDDTEHLRGTSVGDVIRVMNVQTSSYCDTVSLNSSSFTRIIRVQKAAVQQVTMDIIGIRQAGRIRSELEAHMSGEVETFTVSSPLLAEALLVELEDDFEDGLLKNLPISAKAEIQGNEILKFQVSKEM